MNCITCGTKLIYGYLPQAGQLIYCSRECSIKWAIAHLDNNSDIEIALKRLNETSSLEIKRETNH